MTKTGLGLTKKSRRITSLINLYRFSLRKKLLGFDHANLMTRTVDKQSLLLILGKNGARIGKNCDIETGLIFHNCTDYAKLQIGDNCHVGKNCFFDLREPITIKDNVTISMECKLITHQDLGFSNLKKFYPNESRPIVINDHAYLGINSIILMGCEIGEGSVIAANSLVNASTDPYRMYGGSPAKFIKSIAGKDQV